jgi:tripartite-type tricarboxylate transporter receptor subunit TctC
VKLNIPILIALCVANCAFAAEQVQSSGGAVRVIVAFPTGSPPDFIMRLINEPLQRELGRTLVIDNRPGAGGNLAAEAVARAKPDGSILLAAVDTVVTVNPVIYRKLSFQPQSELLPIIYLANSAQMIVCNPSVPVRSIHDLISYARSNKLVYASGGAGVPGHLAAELFASLAVLPMTHVPYKGPGPAAHDLMAGSVSCGFLNTGVVLPLAKAGKLRALAVTSKQRIASAPEVPTVSETVIPNYEATFGEILLTPRGTPETTITRLNRALVAALRLAEVRDRMQSAELEFIPNSPAEAMQRLRREADKWRPVIEKIGLQVD